jgi:hypothetical protein
MSVVIDTNVDFGSEVESEISQMEPTVLLVEPELKDKAIALLEEGSVEPVATPTAVYEEEDDNADFRARIWNAEMRCRGKEAIVEDLKEQLKFAKADYDDAVSALRKLATDGNKPMPLFDHAKKVEAEAEAVQPVEKEDDSWRAWPLFDLLNSSDIDIKGLGKKKIEALTDLYPTFGHFQDLRISASLEGKPLKEVLPEGFGQKIADQIEEVFLNAMMSPLKAQAKIDLEEEARDQELEESITKSDEPVWEDVDASVDLEDL